MCNLYSITTNQAAITALFRVVTIIRPVDDGEFDADLLVMVDPVEGWTAADYVEELGRVFAGSGTYADKTKVWDYCVTITYAGRRISRSRPGGSFRSWWRPA
jgi:hypothetical protein